jgi:heme/copper-type cytochrome/quinol oxidase subunit 2
MNSMLFGALFWSCAVLCLVAQIAILRSTLAAPRPVDPAAPVVPRGARPLEILWAVVPAVALVLLFLFTWKAASQPPVQQWTPVAAPAIQAAS